MARVAVVRGERGLEPVCRALDLVNYRSIITGRTHALIKVNFITTKNWETGATTDPVVVEAIANKLRETGIDVAVVESDATTTNADRAYNISGMRETCERIELPFINLRHEKERVKLKVEKGLTLSTITVPRIVTESAVISAAKLKTHMETGVTLGMKNMFGLLPDKFKGKYHIRGMHKVIVDINSVLPPALTVIDGFVGMEGRGPVNGKPIKMNTIIAGTDVVAVDATATRIMGIDPKEIGHIRIGHEQGLGDMENIDVVGEGVEAVRKIFARF